jgi:hypothetical protein
MKDFTDIKIVGADDELTNAPNPSKPAMYDVYLKLSADPPPEWAQLFDQEWQNRFYSIKRRGRVEGDHIVIHCALDEIERHHMPELNETLARVNERYQQYAGQQVCRAQQQADRQAAADQQKKDALGRLKFD